jgi:hypothetical protein
VLPASKNALPSPVSKNAFLETDDGMICSNKLFHAKKNSQIFHMILDEVELYIKIVEIFEI